MRTVSIASVAAAAIASALLCGNTPSSAHEVATRCDWSGCSHIVCNYTGDRCHRFDSGDERYGDRDYHRERYYGDDRYHEYAEYNRWYYDCDHDVDNCYVRRGDNEAAHGR